MVVLSSLALMVLGWAFGCCLIYAFWRYVAVELPLATQSCGALALLMWVVFFAFIQVSADFYEDALHPYRVIKGVGAAMICGFAIGSTLLMQITRKRISWWQGVLFCASYLGLCHILGHTLLTSWPQKSGPLFEIAHWNARPNDLHLLMLLVWLFPLGAPLSEIAFRSFWRDHTNKTGSLV